MRKKGENEVKPFLSIRMVSEVIDFLKREYFKKIDEETNNYLSFNNAYVNMEKLLKGDIEGSIIEKKGISKEAVPLCFYHIPHNL
jgi:hypothetical protein